MELDHIWINNVLFIKKGQYQTNGIQGLIDADLKPLSPITLPYDQYTKRYPYQQASTRNDEYCIHHAKNDK